jgi:hypothetical protein
MAAQSLRMYVSGDDICAMSPRGCRLHDKVAEAVKETITDILLEENP